MEKEHGNCSQSKAAAGSQSPHQPQNQSQGWRSPSRPSAPNWERPESAPWVKVQIQGFPIGKTSPTPDGPEGGSNIPCVLLTPRGKSPGTGDRAGQPRGWGRSRGSPPPVPSPGSSSSARKRGIWGHRDPQECPGPAPKT